MNNINDSNIVTAICPNCGVSLTCSKIAPATKCHWCHTMIPADLYIDNPNVPEQILPFKIEKEEAKQIIDEYIKKRHKYSTKEFLVNYNSDNIVPVYLPYMIVDINLHSENRGLIIDDGFYASALGKEYIDRDFNMTIENALVEASKSNYFNSINSTSNIISSVVPFDIENAVEFNANYLNGYLSENRELNIELLKPQINKIVENNVTNFLNQEMNEYFKARYFSQKDTYWYQKKNTVIGSQWSSILLPIWIYSYCEKVDNVNKIYYVAVNGRTGKIVGSIPMNTKKFKNLKRTLNIVFYVFFTIFIYLFYKKFIYTTDPMISTQDLTLVCMAVFLLILLIPIILTIKVACFKKILNNIKNKYIYNKTIDNISNTNINVYDLKYKERYNIKGEMW